MTSYKSWALWRALWCAMKIVCVGVVGARGGSVSHRLPPSPTRPPRGGSRWEPSSAPFPPTPPPRPPATALWQPVCVPWCAAASAWAVPVREGRRTMWRAAFEDRTQAPLSPWAAPTRRSTRARAGSSPLTSAGTGGRAGWAAGCRGCGGMATACRLQRAEEGAKGAMWSSTGTSRVRQCRVISLHISWHRRTGGVGGVLAWWGGMVRACGQ